MMGNKQPAALKERPWRETKGWGESVKNDLKKEVVGLYPETSLQVQTYNILLAGLIGSGKSSFINSITGVIRGGVHLAAAVGAGEMHKSLTKKFNAYQISQDLPFRIFDTMGIDGRRYNDTDILNILRAVEGHVPVGYEFDPENSFDPRSPAYISDPKPADIAHCVAMVVDAQTVNQLTDLMMEKLKGLAEHLFKEQIPFFILLTKVDQICPKVQEDPSCTYRSIVVEELVSKISKRIHGVPKNRIFPIINYSERVDLDDNLDILLLYAIRQMLGASKGFIESLQKQYPQARNVPAELKQEEGSREMGI